MILLTLVAALTLSQADASVPVTPAERAARRQIAKQNFADRTKAIAERIAVAKKEAAERIAAAKTTVDVPLQQVSLDWSQKIVAAQLVLKDASTPLDKARARIELTRLNALAAAEKKKVIATAARDEAKEVAEAKLAVAMAEAQGDVDRANANADRASEEAAADAK